MENFAGMASEERAERLDAIAEIDRQQRTNRQHSKGKARLGFLAALQQDDTERGALRAIDIIAHRMRWATDTTIRDRWREVVLGKLWETMGGKPDA